MMNADYIIVGAGSAGCALAYRLSEDPQNRVILLEAGGKDRNINIHAPAGYVKLHRSKVDWSFETVPQVHVNNRRMFQPRGKTLGGSSSTNCMAYIRGNRRDYDDWAAMGNPGWSYDEVLPYFKLSEHNEDLVDAYHGQGGPLNVTQAKSWSSPLGQAFVGACADAGMPLNPDFNGAQQTGAGFFQFTILKGQRCSTARAFLHPIKSRKNLQVITHAHTQRLLLEGGQVVGVEYLHRGKTVRQVRADREVILAAGAFGSPQIMMLSGIGAPAELEAHDIEVQHALPGVGKNLQDHLICGLSIVVKQKKLSLNTQETLGNYLRYFFQHAGPLTHSPLMANAFMRTNEAQDRPNMQLHFAPVHGQDMHDYSSLPKNTGGCSIFPTLLRPKSVGTVSLKSADPLVSPLIDPHYFEAPEDLEAMLAGARMARELLLSDAFAPFRSHISYPKKYESDADLKAHLLKKVETCYHPVGTCKMGQDELAVVDASLRVHGLKGLRVADASIMPQVVAGNTNAPVIMIAEKAAAMILEQSPLPSLTQTREPSIS